MSHDDFQVEPIRGLPEIPPEGESILWQGAPDPISLARQALNASWIAAYFVALALWRGVAIGLQDGFAAGLMAASWYVAIGVLALAVVGLIAWLMARATVYTLTTHRVAMRIGAAFSVTINLPYRWIQAADVLVHRDGSGTIVLDLKGDTKLSYFVLWPHVKPWSFAPTRPALRAIPDPRGVAAILGRAAKARVSEVVSDPALAAAQLAAE